MAIRTSLLGLMPCVLAFEDSITTLPTYGPIKTPQVVVVALFFVVHTVSFVVVSSCFVFVLSVVQVLTFCLFLAQYAGFVNGTQSGDNTLHYWFAEAENKWTKETPFLVWLNGGPVRALLFVVLRNQFISINHQPISQYI